MAEHISGKSCNLSERIGAALSMERDPGYSLEGCVRLGLMMSFAAPSFETGEHWLRLDRDIVVVIGNQDIDLDNRVFGLGSWDRTLYDIPVFFVGDTVYVPPEISTKGTEILPEDLYYRMVFRIENLVAGAKTSNNLLHGHRVDLVRILKEGAEDTISVDGEQKAGLSFCWNSQTYVLVYEESSPYLSGGNGCIVVYRRIDEEGEGEIVHTYDLLSSPIRSDVFEQIFAQWRKRFDKSPMSGNFNLLRTIDNILSFPTFGDVYYGVDYCTNHTAVIYLPSGRRVQIFAGVRDELLFGREGECYSRYVDVLRVDPFPNDGIAHPNRYLKGHDTGQTQYYYDPVVWERLESPSSGEGFSSSSGRSVVERYAALPPRIAWLIMQQIESGDPEVTDSMLQL